MDYFVKSLRTNKIVVFKICVAVLLTALFSTYVCRKNPDEWNYASGEIEYCDSAEDAEIIPLSVNSVYSQKITLHGGYLRTLILKVCNLDCAADGELYIDIQNATGSSIYSGSFKTFDLSKGKDWNDGLRFYHVISGINQMVEEGQYTVWFKFESEGDDIPFDLGIKKITDSWEEYTENGEIGEGIITLINQEVYAKHFLSLRGIAWVEFVLLLVALFVPTCKKFRKGIFVCGGALLTLTIYAGIELLAEGIHFGRESVTVVIMVFLIFCAITAVLGRFGSFGLGLTGIAIALGNHYVEKFRGEYITVRDLRSLGTAMRVAGEYDYSVPCTAIVMILACLTICTVITRFGMNPIACLIENVKSDKKHTVVRNIALRVASGVCCFLPVLLINLSISVPSGWDNWSSTENFKKFGWSYVNLVMLNQRGMPKPYGYSPQEAQMVMRENSAEIETDNIKPQNLIVIMNESLADLSVWGEFSTNIDYMPFLHSTVDNMEKGWLIPNIYGGNTCITEWEVLTGNQYILLGNNEVPYNFMYTQNSKYSTSSLCSAAQEAGYEAVAMHPYYSDAYGRETVYKKLGFKYFYSLANAYQNIVKLRWNVSDQDDYELIEKYTDENTGTKNFVFNVTIQNHGPYTTANYQPTVELQDVDEPMPEVDQYLSLILESDKALEKLISFYEGKDAPTMVVVFGDHQPRLPDEFYKNITENNIDEAEFIRKKYITPYIIWTNYDRTVEQGKIISPDMFHSYIKKAAGLELNAFDKYKFEVMKDWPAWGIDGFYDCEGFFTKYQDMNELQNEIYNQMKKVQYYNLTTE